MKETNKIELRGDISIPFLKKSSPFFGKDSICQRDSTLLL